MKVFVNWNPVLEEVICVHSTEEGTCEKCLAVEEKNKQMSYWVEGDWFEVLEP